MHAASGLEHYFGVADRFFMPADRRHLLRGDENDRWQKREVWEGYRHGPVGQDA